MPLWIKLLIFFVFMVVLGFTGYALLANSQFAGLLRSNKLTMEKCMEALPLAERGSLGLSAHAQLSGIGFVTKKNSEYVANGEYRPNYILDMGELGTYSLPGKPAIQLNDSETKVQATVQQCPGLAGEDYQAVYVISIETEE